MSIQKLEAELEATRQKIAKQLSMVGRSIQSIDPTLYDKERVLEQAVIDAHLDAPLVEDGPIDMPSVAPAVLELLTPPVKRFFRDGVEHTLTQEQSNEEIDAFIERKILEEQDTSNCKKCRVVIKNGGDWGYCTCCYEETRAQEEQDDEG